MKAIFSHLGGFGKLLALVLLVFASSMIISIAALLAALPFTEAPLFTDGANLNMTAGMLRYFQIVQSFSVFIIPALLAGLIFRGNALEGVGYFRPQKMLLLLSFLIIVASQPLVSYLGVWNSSMQLPEIFQGLETWMEQAEQNAKSLILRFLETDRPEILFLNFLMIAILPAIGEEMLFRGALQPIIGEWLGKKHLAVWITAFIFSAIHLQFFTFLPRFFLGLALGYLMLWGKNIWYPIVGHFANNFLSLVIFYYYRYNQPEINPLDPTSEQMPLYWIIPAAGFLIFLFHRFYAIRGKYSHTGISN